MLPSRFAKSNKDGLDEIERVFNDILNRVNTSIDGLNGSKYSFYKIEKFTDTTWSYTRPRRMYGDRKDHNESYDVTYKDGKFEFTKTGEDLNIDTIRLSVYSRLYDYLSKIIETNKALRHHYRYCSEYDLKNSQNIVKVANETIESINNTLRIINLIGSKQGVIHHYSSDGYDSIFVEGTWKITKSGIDYITYRPIISQGSMCFNTCSSTKSFSFLNSNDAICLGTLDKLSEDNIFSKFC